MPKTASAIAKMLKRFWTHPLVRSLDVETADRILVHRELVEAKPILKANLRKWYAQLLPAVRETASLPGRMVELGSGAGFLEEIIPDVVKTDVLKTPLVHEVQNACSLTYSDNSLRILFLVGVLHHLENIEEFLKEADRTLQPGGRLVMIEPHNSFPQRTLCRILDHYEYFDDTVGSWRNKTEAGIMTSANLALPWVVFIRDRNVFEKKFPRLVIRKISYHSLFLLLLSGGMSYRSFVPGFMLPLVQFADWLLSPFMKYVGTVLTIDVEKQ